MEGFELSSLVSALIKSLDKGTLDAFVSWRDLEALGGDSRGISGPTGGYLHGMEDDLHDPRMLVDRMIRQYAACCGVTNSVAWQDFDRLFNTTYRTDLVILRRRYCKRAGLASIGRLAYLESMGRLDEALAVAGKLLDQTRY